MRITGQLVIALTAEHYGLPMQAFLGPRRTQGLARPRQIAMWLCRRHCPHLSFPEIGRRLGGRDHTTIIHGVSVIERLIAIDPDMAAEVEALDLKIQIAAGRVPPPAPPPPEPVKPFRPLTAPIGEWRPSL